MSDETVVDAGEDAGDVQGVEGATVDEGGDGCADSVANAVATFEAILGGEHNEQ